MQTRVLVCEDDRAIANQIVSILPVQSLDVSVANSRAEALKCLDTKFFSAAIIDLNLEGRVPEDWHAAGGVEVLRKIAAQGFGTEPIVLTANPDTEFAFELGRDLGVRRYIAKGRAGAYRLLLSMLQEALSASRVNYPEEALTALSRARTGAEMSQWLSQCLHVLSIKGGSDTIRSVLRTIIHKIYPIALECHTAGLHLDVPTKSVTACCWSYLHASAVCINIVPVLDGDPGPAKALASGRIRNIEWSITVDEGKRREDFDTDAT